MNLSIALVAAVLASSQPQVSKGAKEAKGFYAPKPYFSVPMKSPDQVDSISMACRSDNESEALTLLHCTVSQITVIKTKREDLDIKSTRARIASGKLKPNLNDLKRDCAREPASFKKTRALVTSDAMIAGLEAESKFSKEICSCKTAECILDIYDRLAAAGSRSCQIWGNIQSLDFKRVSGSAWISVSGPNICGDIVTVAIEYDNTKDLWTYNQRKMSATTKDRSSFCGEPNGTYRASSDPRLMLNALMGCDSISGIYPSNP